MPPAAAVRRPRVRCATASTKNAVEWNGFLRRGKVALRALMSKAPGQFVQTDPPPPRMAKGYTGQDRFLVVALLLDEHPRTRSAFVFPVDTVGAISADGAD